MFFAFEPFLLHVAVKKAAGNFELSLTVFVAFQGIVVQSR